MGEWTRKRPLLALVAFHQQALYVYISPVWRAAPGSPPWQSCSWPGL
jgi:hypothetical protein